MFHYPLNYRFGKNLFRAAVASDDSTRAVMQSGAFAGRSSGGLKRKMVASKMSI
jgi:hypothetical protein